MNNRTTIMIALLAVVMMMGPASAATYPTTSPGTKEVFMVNGSTINGSTGVINATWLANTTGIYFDDGTGYALVLWAADNHSISAQAIEFAINNASYQNKTIIIGPGMYNATTTLTLDQDAMIVKSHSTASTVIINATGLSAGTATIPNPAFWITADNVTVGGSGTGLTINGTFATDYIGGVTINSSNSGTTIRDNNITNTHRPIFLSGLGGDNKNVTGLTIANNTITATAGISAAGWGGGNAREAITFMADVTDPDKLINSTITENTISNYAEGICLVAVNNTVISNNVISDCTWSGIALDRRGGTPTTNVTISGNTVTNVSEGTWSTGIAVDKANCGVYALNITNITITSNTVSDCSVNIGLRRITDDDPMNASEMRNITVMYNNISNAVRYGLYNGHNASATDDGTPLDATLNYWGSEYGPGGNGSGIGGDGISTNVTYLPWLKSDDITNVTTLQSKNLIAYPVTGVTVDEYAYINVTIAGNITAYDLCDYSTGTPTLKMVKVAGPGTIDATLSTAGAGTADNATIFTVMATAAGEYTLRVYETSVPLSNMDFNQTFAATPTGATVTADNSTLVADGTGTVNVTLQLDSPTSGATVTWNITNEAAAGVTRVSAGTTSTTNATGAAKLRITAANSSQTLTITGTANLEGTEYSGSCTVSTIAGSVDNDNSALWVNNSNADITTGIDAGATLIPVGVLLKDSQDNPAEGITVTLSANTTAEFVDSTPTSNSAGWANTTVTLPTEVNTTMIRVITGTGNLSATIPELNQTLNVTTTSIAVNKFAVSPGKSIGLKNEPGTTQVIEIQLQDVYGNNNTTASVQILVTTDNTALGNMTNDSTYYDNNLYITTDASGIATFTYQINTSDIATANLTINATAYDGVEDTITISTSGPTGIHLYFNKSIQLVGNDVLATAQLIDDAGNSLAISGKNITFTVRNPSSSLVGTGEVSTVAAGTATFTITSAMVNNVPGAYTVVAKNATLGLETTNTTTFVGPAVGLVLEANQTTLTVNQTVLLNATMIDANDLTTSSLDDETVQFIVDGVLIDTVALSSGVASTTYTRSTPATVTVEAFYNVTLQDSVSVTFAAEVTLSVDTIEVTPAGPLTMNVTETETFTAVCKNGTTVLDITVEWASSNTTVGAITAAGVFTADVNGTTTITATAQGVTSNEVSVTVGVAGLPQIGDINGNGAVTLADAIYLAKHVAGMSGYETLSDDGDINGNGAVTLADAIYLAKHVAGMSGYETLY